MYFKDPQGKPHELDDAAIESGKIFAEELVVDAAGAPVFEEVLNEQGEPILVPTVGEDGNIILDADQMPVLGPLRVAKTRMVQTGNSVLALLPPGSLPISPEEYAAIVAEMNKQTPEQQIAAWTSQIQTMLDDKAREMGYDDIRTAVTYADEPAVPKFQSEGKALRAWRSRVWARGYEILGAVEAGNALPPANWEALRSQLPTFSGG